MTWIDIIGHLAALFVILGVIQKTVRRMRICMVIGSTCFVAYGITIHAWPVVIANGLIGLVSLIYLFKNIEK